MPHPDPLPQKSTPLYRQVADLIFRDHIEPNPAGTKLPSLREVEKSLGVSSITIRAAYDELEKRGALERRHGSGSYSLKTPADQKHVALLLESSITNQRLSPFYPHLLQAIRLALFKRNIPSRTYLGYLAEDVTIGELTCREVLDDLRYRRLNAIVPICAGPHHSWYSEFDKHQVPIFWPGGNLHHSVHKVLEYFRDKGCRSIAAFSLDDRNVTPEIRRWKETAASFGIRLDDSLINLKGNPWRQGSAAQEFRSLWHQLKEKPDGILFADDLLFADSQSAITEEDLPGLDKTEIVVIGSDAVPLTSKVRAQWYQLPVQTIANDLAKTIELWLQQQLLTKAPQPEGRFKLLEPTALSPLSAR